VGRPPKTQIHGRFLTFLGGNVMQSGTYDLIKAAIRGRQAMEIVYGGYSRRVCPHVLGSTKGIQHALFYQHGGGSKSGLKPDGSPANGRCVFISEITSARTVDDDWHTAFNWSVNDQKCVSEVDVSV
jgi:hypothetical protein